MSAQEPWLGVRKEFLLAGITLALVIVLIAGAMSWGFWGSGAVIDSDKAETSGKQPIEKSREASQDKNDTKDWKEVSADEIVRALGNAERLQQPKLDEISDSIVARGDTVLSPLSELLDEVKEASVERASILILRRIGGGQAESILQKMITDSERTEKTREQAIIASADFKTKAMYDFLKEFADQEKNKTLRYAARTTMMHIRKYEPGLIPNKGSVSLAIAGDVKVGGRITITVTAMASEDSGKSWIWIRLPEGFDVVSGDRNWKGKLPASIKKELVLKCVITKEGTWPIVGNLRANFDRREQELHRSTKYMVVGASIGKVLDKMPSSEKKD